MIQNYQDLTRLEMEAIDKENTLVLLPLGAIEQHGNQAPLGTDAIIAKAMCETIQTEMEKTNPDFPMLVFPVLSVGLSTEHKDFCGSITLKPMTYYHVLYDICESLAHHGFKKVVLLVCHGGNTPVAQLISREIRSDFGLCPFVLSAGAFDDPSVQATISEDNDFDFHGGEMETSMVMAVDENLVKLETSEKGIQKNQTLQLHAGWLASDWVTEQGKPIGIGGDPKGASAEKGKLILKISAQQIIEQLLKIHHAKL